MGILLGITPEQLRTAASVISLIKLLFSTKFQFLAISSHAFCTMSLFSKPFSLFP